MFSLVQWPDFTDGGGGGGSGEGAPSHLPKTIPEWIAPRMRCVITSRMNEYDSAAKPILYEE